MHFSIVYSLWKIKNNLKKVIDRKFFLSEEYKNNIKRNFAIKLTILFFCSIFSYTSYTKDGIIGL